jgi:hypothetical protein
MAGRRCTLSLAGVQTREALTDIWQLAWLATVLALSAATVRAQAPAAPTPGSAAEASAERPGLIRVGAWYLTPYLNIGTLGVDTNVFYAPTDRLADFIASGGPGLEIVRPFGGTSRFRLDGGVNYLYFARTESQRRLTGYGSALLELEGTKTRFVAEERYNQTYSRPSFEVDTRVLRETEGTRALLRRNLGDRVRFVLYGNRSRTDTEDQEYLGTNLGDTLTEDRYVASAELQLALSVKTSLVGGGEQQWHRFPRLPERDGDSTLAFGGFRTDQTALISGRALGGYRWFRLDTNPEGERGLAYADVDATLSFKTKLGARFVRDLEYSAFATSGSLPTLLIERMEVFFDKVLANNIYLRLFARQERLITDGEVVLDIPDEGGVSMRRDDRIREAGAELGYQFRSRVRMGVSAIYTERRSNIETFGIQGLLAGFTVTYNPPEPVFR